jgi:predicted aspartyl protease
MAVSERRTYSYDHSGFVAQPTIGFYVTRHGGSRLCAGRALLDTGATISALPSRVLSELEAQAATVVPVEDALGFVRDVAAYDVHFTVPEHFSAPLRVLSTNSEEPLIGRDVIDSWRITFDGPKREIEVEPVL